MTNMENDNIRRRDDHDLLIELKSKIEQVSVDVKDLKDGLNTKVSDHETRIRSLESKISNYAGSLVALQFVIGIVLWYFNK